MALSTRRFVVVLIFIASGIGIVVFRQPLAVLAWGALHCGFIVTILDSRNAVLYETMGTYYFTSDHYDIDKAKGYFEKALAVDTRVPLAHYQLARIYFIRGDSYLAEVEIHKELELYPDFKRSYYVRGLIYGYSGRLSEAAADFKTFLEWKPHSWAAHNDLAWVYFRAGKYAEARDTARAGLNIAPNNPWLLNSLGVALLNTGDKQGAKTAFTQALASVSAMSPEDWGKAYPGNDPAIYREGFSKMKESIQSNLELLDAGDSRKSS
jgi:tetratricopeptide (TPR) repeat protein